MVVGMACRVALVIRYPVVIVVVLGVTLGSH